MEASSPHDYFQTVRTWGHHLTHNTFVDERITFLVLSILTVSTISVATITLCLAYPFLIAVLPISALTFSSAAILIHAYTIYLRHGDNPQAQTALRVDFLFKHLVMHLLITGSVLMGVGFAALIFGGISLFSAIALGNVLAILNGLLSITLSTGFLLPFGKLLIELAHEIQNNHARHFMEALRNIFINALNVGRDGALIALSCFLNDLVTYLEHLHAEHTALDHLLRELDPLDAFTEERLAAFLEWAIPNASAQTLHYLLDRAGDRIPLDRFMENRHLPKIENLLQDRLRAALDLAIPEAPPPLPPLYAPLADIEAMTWRLHRETRLVDRALGTIRPFAPHFEQARARQQHLTALRQQQTARAAELEPRHNRFLPAPHHDEEEEPAWLACAVLGRWTQADFEAIAQGAHIPVDQIERRMRERGLHTEADLRRTGIIPPAPIDPLELRRRLTLHIAPRPTLAHIDFERVSHDIEHLAEAFFHTLIPFALGLLVVGTAPIATLLGVAVGLLFGRNPNEAAGPLGTFTWSVQARSRALFIHLFATRLILLAPPIGAFLAGVYFAGDVREVVTTTFYNIIAPCSRGAPA